MKAATKKSEPRAKAGAGKPATTRAPEGYRIRTQLIHGKSKSAKWDYSHHVIPPISSSATFRLSSSQRGAKGFFEFACDTVDTKREVPIYIYDRLDEPTRGMLEENLAVAEGGDVALCFATGMAAITAALCALVRAGDEVLAHQTLYGCTYSFLTNWLPRQGVTARFADFRRMAGLARAIRPQTRVVYFETPVNPTLEQIDIAAVRAVVDRANRGRRPETRMQIVVDNTFATPYCQRPIEHGAHIVVHSLTKAIGGFGTDMGGAVIGPQSLHNHLMLYRKDFGGVLSPKAALAGGAHGQHATHRHARGPLPGAPPQGCPGELSRPGRLPAARPRPQTDDGLPRQVRPRLHDLLHLEGQGWRE